MAASADQTYHVFGPCIPQCNVGTAGAMVALGECQDGGNITIQPIKHGIRSDGGGGSDGGDVEKLILNAIATIRFKLVPFSGLYINKLRAWAIGSATEGQAVLPGTLLGGGGFLPQLYLPLLGGTGVVEPDGPWYFPNCEIIRPGDVQVHTKETTPEFEFKAMIYYNPVTYTSINGRTLYTRAAP